LLLRGRKVRSLVHANERPLDNLDTEIIKGDIGDIESLYRAFNGADVVYHLASHISTSMNDWSLCEAINIIGTQNVVDACRHCNVRRLAYFSSIHTLMNKSKNQTIDESCPIIDSRDYPPYCYSKAIAEQYVINKVKDGLDAVIINPTAVIGPFDFKPSRFGKVIILLARHKLPVLIGGGFDWVDVRDVVEGAIQAEENGATGSRYILSGHQATLPEIAGMLSSILNIGATRIVIPGILSRAGIPLVEAVCRLNGTEPLYNKVAIDTLSNGCSVSHNKATRELGYQSRPLFETLDDTLRWFIDNDYLSGPRL
jgi:dihydroflavonol-4-reductase